MSQATLLSGFAFVIAWLRSGLSGFVAFARFFVGRSILFSAIKIKTKGLTNPFVKVESSAVFQTRGCPS